MLAFRFCTALVLVVLSVRKAYLFKIKDLRDGCNTTDLKRFWNTTEAIWTITTADTATSGLSCQVDVRENVTGLYMYFERSHYGPGKKERKTVPLKGLVSSRTGFDLPGMLLYYTNGTMYAVEYLLYESPDSSCGVFKFQEHPDGFRLDLRVKNSSVGTEPYLGCSNYFNKSYEYYRHRPPYPNITPRRLYNYSCQAILQSTQSVC